MRDKAPLRTHTQASTLRLGGAVQPLPSLAALCATADTRNCCAAAISAHTGVCDTHKTISAM